MTRFVINRFLLLFCFNCLVACSNHSEVSTLDKCNIVASVKVIDGDTLTVCDLTKVNDTVIVALSSLIHKLEIIKLDTCREALTTPGESVGLSEHYIATAYFLEPIRLFNRLTGKHICNVGGVGQGPGEYVGSGVKVQIDEESNRIYTKSRGEILIYDLGGRATASNFQ